MSKERARRRAEREALRATALAKRLRRERRRALLRRLVPRRRWRWAWGLGRRSPGQRAAVAGLAIVALAAVWYFVDSLSARVGLSVLVLLVLPVFAVISFDRKGLRL